MKGGGCGAQKNVPCLEGPLVPFEDVLPIVVPFLLELEPLLL